MELFSVQNLCVEHRRDGKAFRVLSDASFALAEGTLGNLVGPSGCGKSTLLRACARLMPRAAGQLFFCGIPAERIEPQEWRSKVLLAPQNPSLVPGTVQDNLLLPYTLKIRAAKTLPTEERLRELMDMAGMADIELSRDIAQLSGGQIARVALLRAFAADAQVLLLDEVDAALDEESARAIGKLTRAMVDEGRACLRITHRNLDDLGDVTFRVQDGQLKEDL